MAPLPSIAFLSEGKLFVKSGDEPLRVYESRFGREVRERAIRIERRESLKLEGEGGRFIAGGLVWGAPPQKPGEFSIRMTGLSRGREPGEILFALGTNDIGGVFALKAGNIEQRLFHSAERRVQDLAVCDAMVACAVDNTAGTSNLALMNSDGSHLTEVTEGDSLDLSPCWVPGEPRCLVFQTAGVGRDQSGAMVDIGPFSIQKINFDRGEIETLIEDPKFDFLSPRLGLDGTLFCIRRPYRSRRRLTLQGIAAEFVNLPSNLAGMMNDKISSFAERYSRKPLSIDRIRGKFGGRLINRQAVERTLATARDGFRSQSVPASWCLMARKPGSKIGILAGRVSAYDLCDDGSFMYSSGSAIFHVAASGHGRRQICRAGNITNLVVMP